MEYVLQLVIQGADLDQDGFIEFPTGTWADRYFWFARDGQLVAEHTLGHPVRQADVQDMAATIRDESGGQLTAQQCFKNDQPDGDDVHYPSDETIAMINFVLAGTIIANYRQSSRRSTTLGSIRDDDAVREFGRAVVASQSLRRIEKLRAGCSADQWDAANKLARESTLTIDHAVEIVKLRTPR